MLSGTLAETLEELVEAAGGPCRIELDLDPELDAAELTDSQRIAIVRIVQAALANVVRHSGAATARVQVLPGRPAAAAGMRTGDRVVAIDGAPIGSFNDLMRELRKADAPPDRRFEVQREGRREALDVRPQNGLIGVSQDKVLLRVSIAQAVPRAARDVWALNAATLRAIWDLLRGRGGASLAGPIGIVKQASAEVRRGFSDFAGALASLSVSLAIFNFLPVPALDGGRLVFLGIELVSGRRVNQRAETVVHLVGFLFLLALVLAITLFSDLHLGRALFRRG